ncbi:DUF4433 domain-containing protein [Cryobacterium suzukii]|uniref:DUF4433 domain-containing protein n=1 Tax=Cryobacterium suzukii TaxID=1259198 RepID=A0A4R9AFE3_9MICO|nr:DUF4433 domain-containing protein [Cryobacterium suzukii]
MVEFRDAPQSGSPLPQPRSMTPPDKVWVTGGGERYHADRSCRSLLEGRGKAVENGFVSRMGRWLALYAAQRQEREPCRTCYVPRFGLAPSLVETRVPAATRLRVDDLPIYHLTHVRNLPAIVQDKQLFADANLEWHARPLVDISSEATRTVRRAKQVNDPSSFVADFVPFSLTRESGILRSIIGRRPDPRLGRTANLLVVNDFVRFVSSIHQLKEWRREASADYAPTFILAQGDGAHSDTRFGGRVLEFVERGRHAAALSVEAERLRQAELLVRDRFPFRRIQSIEVQNETTRRCVLGVLAPLSDPPEVVLSRFDRP